MKRANPWRITGIAGGLALAVLLACLGQATAASTAPAPANVPKFTVLNPEAPLPEIDTKALAPRLTSLAGKTIIIYDDKGGYEKPMGGLAAQLKPLLPPDTKLVYYEPKTGPGLDLIPKGDAVIVGHGY